MLLNNTIYLMDHSRKRQILAITSALVFIAAFVVNITSDTSLYNVDLNVVPGMQDSSSLGSSAFITFMNIVSNVFNPVICAGYIAIFWLVSSRKLEIMVFLVWFIFLSWVLSLLKSLIHQSRPYWVQQSGVKMLQWTCYSEFGCPSGHSMLGLVLMEFIIRFFARQYDCARRFTWLLYIILFILQILVMFSRVILGMHTFNQVLFGAMVGMYSISIYYLYIQALILKYFNHLIRSDQKRREVLILIIVMVITFIIEILITYIPSYDFSDTYSYIVLISGCEKVKEYKSFQYKCFEDSALLTAAYGLIIGLLYMEHPQNLTKPLAYSRCSCKYATKLAIMILLAVIPAAIFLNPFWGDINTAVENLALIIWICQSFGFFFAIIMLLLVSPVVGRRWGLEEYKASEYIQTCKRLQAKQGEVQLSPRSE